MILFKREFNRNLKALIIWTAIMAGLMLMMLSIYPQFAKQQETIDQMMKAFPEAMVKAFNMDKLSMKDVLGFYAIECYLMLTLFGSIYAAMLGAGILSKEENEKTIEFLLSKPISRSSILTQKLLLVTANLVIFNGLIAIVNLIGFSFTKDNNLDMTAFALLTAGPLLMHIVFAVIGFMISCLVRKSRNILTISLGLVFGTYFFSIMASMSEKFEFLKYLSPFKYVDSADLIINKSIKPLYLAIMLGVIIISTAASFFIYNRKDIAV
ncbi:MAG: ABC transporter permease subunit [Bacillota bacterium]